MDITEPVKKINCKTFNVNSIFILIEIVGAIVSILIIWLLTGILVYEGIRRIIHKEIDIDADVMLIIAGLGVAINIM